MSETHDIPEIPDVPDNVKVLELHLKWLAHEYFASMKRTMAHKRMINDLKKRHPNPEFEEHISKNIVDSTLEALNYELEQIARKMVRDHPVWDSFFKHIRGAGHITALFLLGLTPARKFPNTSKLWKYIGLAPRHVYDYKKSFQTKVKWAVYNCLLSFLRVGPDKSKYAAQYYYWREKFELENEKFRVMENWRKHRWVLKALARMFVSHYWEAYRETFGLPVVLPYFVVAGGENLYIPFRQMFDM